MGIKDLFDEKTTLKVLANQSLDEVAGDVESVDFMKRASADKDRFVPYVDFSKPKNFARFGSAERYYDDALKRIYNQYPYDGSRKEKIEWHLTSSYLDNYIFENEYPRTNGFALFSPAGWGTQVESIGDYGATATASYEYIQVKGGPNKDAENTLLQKIYPSAGGTANIYDTSKNRESNLKLDLQNKGVTVEFWLQKDGFTPAKTNKEIIFDLWNGEASSSAGYGRLTIEISGTTASESPFYITAQSGTTGFFSQQIGASIAGTGSLASWGHYAFSFVSASAGIDVKFYVNGDLNKETSLGSSGINEITGSLVANIGALRTSPSGSGFHANAMEGWGKLSGSIDEFRFWKTKRTSQEVGRYWFTQVGAGTNTDTANTKLGVYYKFNEGIVESTSADSIVLDYSGRVSNGSWTGYSSDSRSTKSAMVLASAATSEFKDPILNTNHSRIIQFIADKRAEGKTHDHKNNSMIYHSMPSWILEEDGEHGHLRNLTQIVSSYFDTLHLQIEALPTIHNATYLSSSASSSFKPLPFADKLLASRGLIVPEIFADATILEYFGDRDEYRDYEFGLSSIKNIIYQNIYNNLSYIYKSKGTEKALRNIIRCFGVDDELIKINLYASDYTYSLEDNFRATSVRNSYVDFNHPDRFGATVHQYANSKNSNTVSFISASKAQNLETGLAITIEAEVLFPEKFTESDIYFFDTAFTTASLFGAHTADTDVVGTDTTLASPDVANFQVSALRREANSSDIKFQLTGTAGGFVPHLTSGFYPDTYNNERWVLAVRLAPTKFPNVGKVSGSANDTFSVNFYGVNVAFGDIRNEFEVTGTITAAQGLSILSNPKRIFVGAHRENLTGSVLQKTDVKIGSCRVWYDYVSNDSIRMHAIDPTNYGTLHPYRSAYLFEDNLTKKSISEMETLALNWTFETVTSSNSSGEFVVPDLSSGSVESQGRYGWISKIINSQHSGRGYGFPVSNTGSVDKDYIFAYKQQLPEILSSEETVKVLGQDDLQFTRESRPQSYFFAFEKSMYQEISYEMLNMFSTIEDFNNLIGEPVNRYRQDYKSLAKLRELYFERVRNTPDFEKFVEFYKWFDDSLNLLLQQFIPASANTSEKIRTMIESHILERNKYWTKFPTLEMKESDPETGIRGINELLYDWRTGHAPFPNNENKNCLWWKEKAEREGVISSGDSGVDTDRDSILDATLQVLNRRFSTPHRFTVDRSLKLRGGTNLPVNKRPNAFMADLKPGTTEAVNITLDDVVNCEDGQDSPTRYGKKIRIPLKAVGRLSSEAPSGKVLAPFTVFSSSAENKTLEITANKEITNLHHDGYGDFKEKPLQGPFTEEHVGGLQYRHVKLNAGTDIETSRAEGFRVKISNETVSLMQPEKDSGGNINMDLPTLRYHRDEVAKRPVNIRNILQTTGSTILGNYDRVHQVVQTSNRKTNNKWWVENATRGGTTILFDQDSFVPSGSRVMGWPYFTGFEGVVEFARPQRGKTPHVIVERFSAPGGPETAGNSDGGPNLDVLSGEYSIYNMMNYRNPLVRQFLNQESISECGQFGFHSDDGRVDELVYDTHVSGTASFHKINRNSIRRIEYAAGYDAGNDPGDGTAFVTTVNQDNLFIQHPIPQSDLGYAWITASVLTAPFGFATDTRRDVTNKETITFLSASDFGSYLYSVIPGHPTSGRVFGATPRIGDAGFPNNTRHTEFLSTDFVGLNYHIYEPTSGSDNTLGYTHMTVVDHGSLAYAYTVNYINNAYVDSYGDPNDAVWANVPASLGQEFGFGVASVLNAILLNRNGPYGYPTWKQIRTGEHPVARHQRNNNRMDYILPLEITTVKVNLGFGITMTQPRVTRFQKKTVIEPMLSSKYKPLRHTLVVDTTTNEDEQENKTFILKHTYGNNLSYFANKDLNDNLTKFDGSGLEDNPTRQIYDDLTDLYVRSEADPEANPIKDFVSLRYRETIYPKEYNTFLARTRSRTNYDVASILKWRSARLDRHSGSLTNSQGFPHTGSLWPLDGRFDGTDFENAETLRLMSEGVTKTNPGNDGAGELLNDYAQFHNGNVENIKPSALYARREIYYHGAPTTELLVAGDAKWEAAEQSGKLPFYDDYNDFAEDIKRVGKDYTIVPEFRISDHIEYYVDEQSGDFRAEIPGQFQVDGALLSSSANNSSIENRKFYQVYGHSDFMKFFDIIQTDHKGVDRIGGAASIRLVCKAIKKFRPREGFYPAQRGLQLATLFSKSYGPVTELAGTQPNFRTMLQPFYAPGIFFNTIKSGLAVDYPVFSRKYIQDNDTDFGHKFLLNRFSTSWEDAPLLGGDTPQIFIRPDIYNYFDDFDTAPQFGAFASLSASAIDATSQLFDRRLPFESIIDPFYFLGGFKIADNEPHRSASIDSTASLGGTPGLSYRLAIHNFLAETIDFFIDGENLKFFASKDDNAATFGQVRTRGRSRIVKEYVMDIILREGSLDSDTVAVHDIQALTAPSSSINMYTNPAAFGPPVFAGGMFGSAGILAAGYAPFTPPYYDGHARARITFSPIEISSTPRKYGVREIISALQYEYTGTTVFNVSALNPPTNLNHDEAMQVSASINLDTVIRSKKAVYNIAGKIVGFEDDPNSGDRWVMQTKMETPILDFTHRTAAMPVSGSGSVPVGMWHQYGRIPPRSDQGVFFELQDVPREELDNPRLTGSLIDLVGFERTSKRLGELQITKKVSEAVVAVPFLEGINGVQQFLPVDRHTIDRAKEQIDGTLDSMSLVPGESTVTMVRKMRKYVFPPKMDFLQYEDITPFAMYIFEFNHVFSRQDLADMWQNLSPRLTTDFETATATIQHKILERELMESDDLEGDNATGKLRWLVFKVKQKAKKNYYKKTLDSTDDDSFRSGLPGQEDQLPAYSFNWPYDYFSLVELIKLDAEVEYINRGIRILGREE